MPIGESSPGGALGLGVIQGLTEFLPVSSSGHLVLFQEFIEVGGDEVLFDLVLHVGTLLPAVWFYRADIAGVLRDLRKGEGPVLERPGVRLAALVLLATLPTGVLGLAFKDSFEAMFDSPGTVSIALAATAVLLLSTRGRDEGTRDLTTTPLWFGLLLGLAQGLAITPGISRSGSTIALALLLGVHRTLAVKLSFLMSVPAIVGAVLLKSRDADLASMHADELTLGFLAAMISGYGALVLLVRLVKAGRFSSFAPYLFAVSALAGWLALRGS